MNDSPVLGDAVQPMRDLIARFGASRVFISFVRAIIAPARRNVEVPDCLRRDVGLPQRPPDASIWEKYR